MLSTYSKRGSFNLFGMTTGQFRRIPIGPPSNTISVEDVPKSTHPLCGRTSTGYVFVVPGLTPPCPINCCAKLRMLLSLESHGGICEPLLMWYPNRASLSSVGLSVDVTPTLTI